MKVSPTVRIVLWLALETIFQVAFIARVAAADSITGPAQPASGPGGADYPCSSFTVHEYGQGDGQYWIFEPAGPVPNSAPVIAFIHGWGGMTPNYYGAWIEHLARRGNIVIFPRYQSSLRTLMYAFTSNSVAAVKSAFAELQNPSHVKPELDHFAIIGHSFGGAIAPNLAVLAGDNAIPIPRAICCVEPDNKVAGAERIQMPMADLSRIPAETLALVIVGNDDKLAGTKTGQEIFDGMKTVPPANKNFITFFSDSHGTPPLLANHMAPAVVKKIVDAANLPEDNSPRRILQQQPAGQERGMKPTALDYYGFWKLADALTDAAFYGKNRQFALGNTPEQRFMGKWSDGTSIKELEVSAAK